MNKSANFPSWAAFLAMCFLVVGLVGLFASYAGQTPLQRALARVDVLDQVLDSSTAPDAAARIQALRPSLADDAAAVLDGPGPVGARVESARKAAIAEGVAESDAVSRRVRLMLFFVTLMAGAFGVGVLRLSTRG